MAEGEKVIDLVLMLALNPNRPDPKPWPYGWVLFGMMLGVAVPLAIWMVVYLW
jgi:hypothetical protein